MAHFSKLSCHPLFSSLALSPLLFQAHLGSDVIPSLDRGHNLALTRSWLLPGLVATLRQGSFKLQDNWEGKHWKRNKRGETYREMKEWATRGEKTNSGEYKKIKKNSGEVYRIHRRKCLTSAKGELGGAWAGVSAKTFMSFIFLFSWAYTLVKAIWRVVKATEFPSHHQASSFPKNTVLGCYLFEEKVENI